MTKNFILHRKDRSYELLLRWHKQFLFAITWLLLGFIGYSQVNAYSFSESAETFTQITGTTSTATGDDGSQNSIDIGFTFNYGGSNFTTFSVNANGFIRLGANIAATPWTNSITNLTAQSPIIAAFWDDNNLTGGSIKFETTGLAPNRILTIEWNNLKIGGGGSTAGAANNMQMKLYETSNIIEFIYGSTFATTNTVSAYVGLGFGSFLSVTPANPSTASNATQNHAISNTIMQNLGGKKLSFTPPTCISPSALSVTSLTTTSASLSWTASISNPSNGYIWELRTSGAAGSGTTGLVDFGTLANTVTNATMPSLTAQTNYTFHIRSDCSGGDLSGWASLPFFTGYCVASSTNQTSWISAFTSTGATTNVNYTATAGNTGGYANLMATHRITNFIDNGPTPISLTAGGPTCGFAIWIDWNNNLTFEASERVFNTTGFVTTANGTITIPSGTTTGDYRMRVLVDFNASNPTNSCGNISRGEFVDYTFEVSAPPPCVFPTALNTTNILAQSATLNWTASTSNPANGYQWEVRTSGAGGSGATGLVTSGTVAAGVATANATGLSPLSEYTYYVRANCIGGFSDWVSGAFVTPCLPPTVDTTTAGARCGEGTVELAATTAGTTLKWYNVATGGTSIGTGSPFTTPSINTTTSFYVSAGNVSLGNAELGAGATNSGTTGQSFLPGGWGGAKTQYVIRASELIAAGVNAGNINSLAFEPTTSGQTYQGFFVRIGHTTETVSTTTFINSGLTQVFAGSEADNGFTPVANTVNTLAFTSPFNWDGTSNVVVSISWSRVPGAFTATGSSMKVDNVGFNSSVFRQMDNISPQAMQDETSGTAVGQLRPRFIINGQVICESGRTEVVATVSAPPVLTLSSSTANICNGATSTPAITITAGNSDYDNYVWSPSTGVIGDSTTGWTFNPTQTTTYTLTASQSAGLLCATTANVVVTVNPVPTALVITSPVDVCADTAQALSVTGGTLENIVILEENFNGATNNWTTTNLSSNLADPTVVAWTLRPSGFNQSFTTFNSNDVSQFYLSNSDIGGSGNVTNVSLISPTFSTLGFTEANLNFWHFYQHWTSGNGQGNVQYSLDGGTTWVNIQTFNATTGTAIAFANANIALPAEVLNQAAVQLRFQHSVIWGFQWAIDNVRLSGTQTQSITWSPTTNLYTDADATMAYAGDPATMVYFKSSTGGSQEYTITATTGIGCTTTGNVTVNTTVPMLAGTISGATTLCNVGTTTTLTSSGDAGGLWASSNTAFATVDEATGVVTAIATGSVNITYTHSNTGTPCPPSVATHTIDVQVTPAPTGEETQSFCSSGNITQLAATGTDIKWYDAETGGTLLPNVTAIGLVNGNTYYASQTINGCESAERLAVSVQINQPVSAGTNGTLEVCEGTTPTNAQLFAALGGTPNQGGTWSNSGLVFTYTVTAIAPCTDATATVTVTETAQPNAGTNGTLEVCAGTTPTNDELFAALGGSPETGGSWFSNGLVYTYTVTGEAPCANSTATVTVTEIEVATPTGDSVQNFTIDNPGDATLADIVVTGTNLVWYGTLADAQSGTNSLPLTTPLVNGSTYYVVSVNGDCTSTIFAVTVNVTLGVEGFDALNFTYYPNPTSNFVNVQYAKSIEQVEIINLLGQSILVQKPNNNNFTIDMTNLQTGNYLLKVTSEGISHTVKIIKK